MLQLPDDIQALVLEFLCDSLLELLCWIKLFFLNPKYFTPKLISLGVPNGITDEQLLDISTTLTRIKNLNLRSCKKITDEGVKALRSFTGLQKLNLSDCENITDVGVKALGSLTGLLKLDLSYCRNITDEGVKTLGSLTGLQTLDLSGCYRITRKGVLSMSSKLQQQGLNWYFSL